MKKRLHLAVSATALLTLGACGGGVTSILVPLGAELPGLTRAEQEAFEQGKTVFVTTEDPDEGLGPVFNGRSCGECHLQGGIGGAGNDLLLTRVTRIGAGSGASYRDLTELGGPVLQRRSIREFDPASPVDPEVVPPGAEHVSLRITTPLFGAGLIEAIPDSAILSNVRTGDPDGITGTVNYAVSPLTGLRQIGRFGWKAQVATLDHFSADAYLNEMGITTPKLTEDLKPQGKAIGDVVPEPEDDGEDVGHFASFMRLLAPPSRGPQTDAVLRGEKTFQELRCTTCHVPSMTTGTSAVAVLAYRRAELFSDLLVHDMGDGLADGIQQGDASGRQFRTAPLWGLRHRRFFLHDGRATTPEAAIRAHGGEALAARQRYEALSVAQKQDLAAFLDSL